MTKPTALKLLAGNPAVSTLTYGWVAQNDDGEWYHYSYKPTSSPHGWFYGSVVDHIWGLPKIDDWQSTLISIEELKGLTK